MIFGILQKKYTEQGKTMIKTLLGFFLTAVVEFIIRSNLFIDFQGLLDMFLHKRRHRCWLGASRAVLPLPFTKDNTLYLLCLFRDDL